MLRRGAQKKAQRAKHLPQRAQTGAGLHTVMLLPSGRQRRLTRRCAPCLVLWPRHAAKGKTRRRCCGRDVRAMWWMTLWRRTDRNALPMRLWALCRMSLRSVGQVHGLPVPSRESSGYSCLQRRTGPERIFRSGPVCFQGARSAQTRCRRRSCPAAANQPCRVTPVFCREVPCGNGQHPHGRLLCADPAECSGPVLCPP